jgi:uncharacterized membrane protein
MMDLRRSVVYVLVGMTILSSLFILNFKLNILNNPVEAALVSISFFGIIAIFMFSLSPQLLSRERKISEIDKVVFYISMAIFTIVSIGLIHGFGTDDQEYTVQAALNLLKGYDPYTSFNYQPLGVKPTYTVYGGITHAFIYPPLSFLLYIPIILVLSALNLPLYFTNILNIIFQDLLSLIIFRVGIKREDPIAVLPIIFLFITADVEAPGFSGVSASIWATFIALGYLKSGWKGGLFLGLANLFNQISWLITPFLLIYKFKTSREDFVKTLNGFTISIIGLSLPFLIWNPYGFLHIFTTDVSTIPVGLTGLTVLNFTGILEVEPWYFTFMMTVIGSLSLYLYYKGFGVLRETLWIYPMLIMWFSWRTLTEYFIVWPMLMFLSVFQLYDFNNVRNNLPQIKIPKGEISTILLTALVVVGSLGLLAHSQYVSQDPVKVVKVNVNGKSEPITSVNITVENVGDSPVNITLVRVSVPNHLNMVWNYTPSNYIKPGSNVTIEAFTDNKSLSVNGSCLTVQVYSSYYIGEYKVNLTSFNISSSTIS